MRSTTGFGRPYATVFRCLAGALLLVATLFATSASAANSDSELKQERAGVLAKKATAAAKVDALRADDAQVAKAIDALQGNVAAQRQALIAADDSARQARAAADAARDAETKARTVLASAQAGVRATATAAYEGGGAASPVVNGNNIDAVARSKAYGAVVTGRRTDSIDVLNAARKDVERFAKARQSAAATADKQLGAAQQELTSLNSSLAQQQGFADAVSARLDSTLSEAQSLATLDKSLSDEITQRETALAAKLVAASPPRPAAVPQSTVGGLAPTPPPRATTPAPPITITGSGEIVTVRGIQVNRSIADNLARMLSAADGAGLSLSGGGYRSSESQVALRRAHCSGDPYTAPASSCSPPTARPGQSLHEKGLAIDFTCSGSLIRSRSSACWQWLKANAAGFGFFNLPSEAWHWSVNGN